VTRAAPYVFVREDGDNQAVVRLEVVGRVVYLTPDQADAFASELHHAAAITRVELATQAGKTRPAPT
jgi:hypothetical protein